MYQVGLPAQRVEGELVDAFGGWGTRQFVEETRKEKKALFYSDVSILFPVFSIL